MTTRRRRALLAGLMLSVVALSACSGGGKPRTLSESVRSSAEDATTGGRGVESWVGAGPTAHSALKASGGHVIYTGVDGGKVAIVALDPTTGEVAWRHATGVSERILGVVDDPIVTDDAVYVLGEDVGRAAHVVAYASASGKRLWDSKLDGPARSDMYLCDGALCVLQVEPTNVIRLDLASGSRIGAPVPVFEPILLEDGNVLVSADRDTGAVEAVNIATGNALWRHSVEEAFPGAAVSADHGWAGFHRDGVWMVWLGPQAQGHLGAISGIRDDGTVLWTRPDIVPCPTFYATNADALRPLVACSATIDLAAKTASITSFEGIDPATGQDSWRIPDLSVDADDPSKALHRVDTEQYVIAATTPPITFDLGTGPTPPSSSAPWCPSPSTHDTIASTKYLRATTFEPCPASDGKVPTPTAVPAFAGPTIGGYGVWVEEGKVKGRRVG